MSVVLPIEDDPRFRIYVASEGQQAFAIPFPFQDAIDIGVYADIEATWVPIDRASFSISGARNPSGGTVTFSTGRTLDERILVLGEAALERLTSIAINGRFSSTATDDELDRNRIVQQEIRRDVDRALRVRIGGAPLELVDDFEDGDSLAYNNGRIGKGPNVLEVISVGEAAAQSAEEAQGYAQAAAQSASQSSTSAGSSLASANASQQSELDAAALVVAATAGFTGFLPNQGYDFGSVADPITYFDQDWGTIA